MHHTNLKNNRFTAKNLTVSFIFYFISSLCCHAGNFEDALKAGNDKNHALEIYKLKAAAKENNSNSPHAMNKLGFIYQTGSGVEIDYAEAIRWYRMAARLGHSNAMFHLGYLFTEGKGVTQHYETAHMWFNLSASAGDEMADSVRRKLEKNMSSQQISNAQNMALKCQKSNFQNC